VPPNPEAVLDPVDPLELLDLLENEGPDENVGRDENDGAENLGPEKYVRGLFHQLPKNPPVASPVQNPGLQEAPCVAGGG